MNDPEIRERLLGSLKTFPRTRIIEEFPTKWGYTRADVVTIDSDFFNAYEIKSAKDNLKGLPRQQRYYSTLFDHVTVVTEERWLDQVLHMTPYWWGVWRDDGIAYDYARKSQFNPTIHPMALVGILWRSEVKDILEANDFHNLSKLRKDQLWNIAATELDLPVLRRAVRKTLLKRVYTNPRRNDANRSTDS